MYIYIYIYIYMQQVFAERVYLFVLLKPFDWCFFYYFARNSLVALLEALCARGLCCSKILTVRSALVWVFRLILYGSGAPRFRKRSATPAVSSVAERDLRPGFHWDSCVDSDRHWKRRDQASYVLLAPFMCQETYNWYYTSLLRIKVFYNPYYMSRISHSQGFWRKETCDSYHLISFCEWCKHANFSTGFTCLPPKSSYRISTKISLWHSFCQACMYAWCFDKIEST